MDGIGLQLPLNRSVSTGVFTLITSYQEEVKQNFKNLLLTSPGERIMNPNFGVGLRRFLFEQRDLVIPKIRQRITGQVSRYMPYIRINKIQFNHGMDPDLAMDSNVLSILVEYEVPSLNLLAFLIVQAEDMN